ncbi:MAG: enoyl-CoA hydratase/isomerase family protein [Thermoplasmata archaeon]
MYKEFKKLQFWAEDRIGIMALDNGTNNDLDIELLSEILSALSVGITDPEIEFIVMTGTKNTFSMGLNFCEKNFENREEIQTILNIGHSIAATLLSTPKLVVSILNGTAVDAGFELVLLSDIILSKENVKVGFPGLWFDLPHIIGTPALFSSIYGRNKYYKMICEQSFLAESIDVVNKILPADTLMKSAKEYIAHLPYFQNRFKKEVFSLYRPYLDFERYDLIAINSRPKIKELRDKLSKSL